MKKSELIRLLNDLDGDLEVYVEDGFEGAERGYLKVHEVAEGFVDPAIILVLGS